MPPYDPEPENDGFWLFRPENWWKAILIWIVALALFFLIGTATCGGG